MKERDDFDEFDDEGGIENINFGQLFRDCIEGKKKIIKITLAFFLVGVFIAFASPSKYKSTCVFVPQFSQGLSSKFSSLASMAGIDLDLTSTSESNINPKVYPHILEHPGLLLELMHTEMHFEKADHPITLYEYYTDTQYQRFNLLGFVLRYTVGLPRLLIDAVRPENEVVEFAPSTVVEKLGDDLTSQLKLATIYRMTEEEMRVASAIVANLDVDVDAKKGFLTLTATMPEPTASAELCEAAFLALKKYIGDFKRRKASDNIKFLDKQVDESYRVYIQKQEECAKVMDSNMGSLTAQAKVERIRKEGEYKLASQMYSELARQQVSAKVRLEESTVAFTELVAPAVPLRRSSPKRTVLIAGLTIFGFACACVYVCGKASLKRKDEESEQV